MAVWHSLGFAIIIFLAGLQQIPDIYYEAARIDGANRWQLFWRITLPLLNPVIVYLAVLSTISFLRLFALVQNMSPQGTGGPLKSTTTVVLEVYREGFSSYNMGYAGALTVILFVVILLITVVQLRLHFTAGRVLGGPFMTVAPWMPPRIALCNWPNSLWPAQAVPRRPFSGAALAYYLLSLGAVVMVVPFLWMVLTSLKPATELVEFAFWPKEADPGQLRAVLKTSSFRRWYLNSLLIAIFSTICVAFFDSLVGYTLNKFEFPGKNIIFIGILATLMVPTEMLIIPWYTMSVGLGLAHRLCPILGHRLPWRHHRRRHLSHAPVLRRCTQRAAGCRPHRWPERIRHLVEDRHAPGQTCHRRPGHLQLHRQLERLSLAPDHRQRPRVLHPACGSQLLPGRVHREWEKIMTGASMATVPLLLVFILFQRQIIKGIALTGLKG